MGKRATFFLHCRLMFSGNILDKCALLYFSPPWVFLFSPRSFIFFALFAYPPPATLFTVYLSPVAAAGHSIEQTLTTCNYSPFPPPILQLGGKSDTKWLCLRRLEP